MAVKAISEFAIQPGRRDEFVRLFENLVAQHGEDMRAAGCHSTTLYVVVDDPDKAVEITDWDSADAREQMAQSETMGAFAPLFELVAARIPRSANTWWPRMSVDRAREQLELAEGAGRRG